MFISALLQPTYAPTTQIIYKNPSSNYFKASQVPATDRLW
jgi:hypothetical protein